MLAIAAAACREPAPPGPGGADGGADAGPPPPQLCGAKACDEGERCLERPGAPGIPVCIAAGDCRAVPHGRDPFGEALAAAGLDRCTAKMPDDYLGPFPASIKHDPWRLPHFDPVHTQPLTAPGWAEKLVADMGAPAEGTAASTAVFRAAALLGYPVGAVRRVYAPDPNAPLATAMARVCTARGKPSNPGEFAADADTVPYSLQGKVASLLMAVAEAADARDKAFSLAPSLPTLWGGAAAYILPSRTGRPPDPAAPATQGLLLQTIDWEELYQAAYTLLAALEDLQLESEAGLEGFRFDRETPLGRVVIADAGSQTWEDSGKPIALFVDTGGDDVYRIAAGATTSVNVPVSVFVDLGGNDTYGYAEVAAAGDEGRLPSDADGRFAAGDPAQGQTPISASDRPRQGAGRLGIGILYDAAGNDRYRSPRMAQGFGAMGVGVLVDREGDDKYEAEAGAQGSATFGIGLLLDGAGNDEHRLYTFGQGFGYTRGFGALVDGDGDDLYFADPGDPEEGGDPLYFTPQLPGRGNSSFVQGAGFGRRDDGGGGYMSGGLGLLADLGEGRDHYVASVFGQGTGYWFGTGVLHDGGGDDLYEGKWYVQGSAAHFALCVFRDKGGNDRHNTERVKPTATSMGVGHDFSVGWLYDDAGDDTYNAPGLSTGSGNVDGWGFLVDGAGTDRYIVPGGAVLGGFGSAAGEGGYDSFRASRPTLGFQVDVGGADTYTIGGNAADYDGKLVKAPENTAAPKAAGVHLDANDGTLLVLP